LTDPQIITASYASVSKLDFGHESNLIFYRDIGLIFSDGNLSTTHTTFPTEHICNVFCNFFKLQSPSESTASEELSYTDGAHLNQCGEGPKGEIPQIEVIN
jgi:hypothetical protein